MSDEPSDDYFKAAVGVVEAARELESPTIKSGKKQGEFNAK